MSLLSARDEERIERSLEGLLVPADWAALQADILGDPDLRAAYADRAWLHASLRASRERLPSLLGPAAVPASAGRPRRRLVFFAAASLAAAAAVVVAANAFRSDRPAKSVFVATLVQAKGTKWAGSTLPTVEQSKLGPGTLSLVEGMATLKFESGALVTIEAPTRLQVIDAMNCRLLDGAATADVPPSAHGFTITTPDLKVVDLGTRFGVTSAVSGSSHVFVFEGEVILDETNGATGRRLTGGKAFHVKSGSSANLLEPSRLPPIEVVDGWTSIATSFGRGRDGYVRRDATGTGGPQPLLLVKHTELERSWKNERRIVLAFDLAEVNAKTLREAEIVLDPEPSGLGFSALVPTEARFSIYGVTDEALDGWEKATLGWASLPASDDAGPQPGLTRKLAEFSITRASSGEPFAVRNEAIAEFLRGDTNGIATFLMVRQTGESDPSGLVHAFASKEHPTARPPTLRVR